MQFIAWDSLRVSESLVSLPQCTSRISPHGHVDTTATSHTDIHKYTKTLPLTDKLCKLLGCQLAMLHVVVQHVKAGILLPLQRYSARTHKHTVSIQARTVNQHDKVKDRNVSWCFGAWFYHYHTCLVLGGVTPWCHWRSCEVCTTLLQASFMYKAKRA